MARAPVDILTSFGEVSELLTALFTIQGELTVKILALRRDLVIGEAEGRRRTRKKKVGRPTTRMGRKTGRPPGRPPKVRPEEPGPRLTRLERGVSRREIG